MDLADVGGFPLTLGVARFTVNWLRSCWWAGKPSVLILQRLESVSLSSPMVLCYYLLIEPELPLVFMLMSTTFCSYFRILSWLQRHECSNLLFRAALLSLVAVPDFPFFCRPGPCPGEAAVPHGAAPLT